MLPHAHDGPSCGLEGSRLALIAIAVDGELGRPIAGVGAWTRAVLGASVPEAAIDEDEDRPAREDHIGPDGA